MNKNPAPTPVTVAGSGLLLLSRQLQNGVKTQNVVKNPITFEAHPLSNYPIPI